MANTLRTIILIIVIVLLSIQLAARTLNKSVPITEKTIATARVDVKYPLIGNAGRIPNQNTINELLYEKAFELNKMLQLTPEEEKTSSYSARYEVTRNTPPLLSIKYRESFTVARMAEPANAVRSVTIDLNSGRIYKLKELFKAGSNYKQRLDSLITEAINKREKPLSVPFGGIDRDQEFYLTGDSLVVYFQEGIYTNYAEGTLEFPIPFARLKSILLTVAGGDNVRAKP